MAEIRALTIHDISQAKNLSEAEGWNQTEADWNFLLTAPGNVCLGFYKGDELIATSTAMIYEKVLAWIGMVLVKNEHRGQGISKELMSALLERLKSCKSIGLDATPAGQPVYEKFGFKNESRIYRMTSDAIPLEVMPFSGKFTSEKVDIVSFYEIIDYDRLVMGINREILIEYFLREHPHNSLILRRNNAVKGYVLGREGTRFFQIGPLVAETVEDAKELMAGALYVFAGKSLVVDVPEDKIDVIQWLKNSGFTVQRSFMRMHLHDGPLNGIPLQYFLIGGPEFG